MIECIWMKLLINLLYAFNFKVFTSALFIILKFVDKSFRINLWKQLKSLHFKFWNLVSFQDT